jgi:hypothetical protein
MLNTQRPSFNKISKSIIAIFSIFLIILIFFESSLNGILVDTVRAVPDPKLKIPSDKGVSINSNDTKLQDPFMKLSLKAIKYKNGLINGVRATLISVDGNGTADNVDFKLNRSVIISVPQLDQFSDVEGHGKMIAGAKKGFSDLIFRARIYNRTAFNQTSGGVMFFTNSSGSLAFLDTSVAIFKQTDTANNSSLLSAWKWS